MVEKFDCLSVQYAIGSADLVSLNDKTMVSESLKLPFNVLTAFEPVIRVA